MTISGRAEDLLRSILSVRGPDAGGNVPAPDAEVLIEFCELLTRNPREEELQNFLEINLGFLTGVFGFRDSSDLAVLFKPPVGTQFKADFCVLQVSQGGASAHLIEIESAHEKLFTKALTPSKRLSHAIGQAQDWLGWIDRNSNHYARELTRMACEAPALSDWTLGNRGARFKDPAQIQALWNAFGGFEAPNFRTTIIMGLWSELDANEKSRLLDLNRRVSAGGPTIYTFEQLARQANARVDREEL